MPLKFDPKLSILPPTQRDLWDELRDVPGMFTLCGGTAIGLQLGHRESLDFDFIGTQAFDPDALYRQIPFLIGSTTVQKAPNTLTCVVDRNGPVQVSFFAALTIRLIGPALIASDNGVRIASLLDLAGMKAAVVQKRAEAKDYVDLDAIITQGGIGLPRAIAAAQLIYGPGFNPELTLKSLCYFGDGNLNTLPIETQNRLTAAVLAVDLDHLPQIDRMDA